MNKKEKAGRDNTLTLDELTTAIRNGIDNKECPMSRPRRWPSIS
jgi:hypothetical protein